MNSLPRSLMHPQDSCRTVSFLFLVFIYSFIFFLFFFVISLGHWSEFLKMWRMRCDDSKGESFLSLGWNGRWEMERRDGAVKVRHLVEIWVVDGGSGRLANWIYVRDYSLFYRIDSWSLLILIPIFILFAIFLTIFSEYYCSFNLDIFLKNKLNKYLNIVFYYIQLAYEKHIISLCLIYIYILLIKCSAKKYLNFYIIEHSKEFRNIFL